jgi:ATP-binding cassette subfamily F protein uup
MAEKIFHLAGDGRIVQYPGNYSDFKEKMDSQCQNGPNKTADKVKGAAGHKAEPEKKKQKPIKFSFKEQREYEEIDGVIAELEDKISGINAKIAGAFADYLLLQQLLAEKEDLEGRLQEKLERWVYLNELAEKIAKGKP